MASGTGGRSCASKGVPAADAKLSANDSETRKCLRRMSVCSWVSVDNQWRTISEALEPQWLGIDERPVAGDDVRHQLPRCRADAEAVSGETGGDVEARQ